MHLATVNAQSLVVLAYGLSARGFEQAVHLTVGVVVELDLP